jgi:AcrR family transcriptional regulator
VRVASKPRRRAEEIRAALVDAAGALFARHGYDGVSVRDIAAAGDVQPSVVIRYFGTKDALFRQVLLTAEPDPFEPETLAELPRLIADSLFDSSSTETHRRRSMAHAIVVRSMGSDEARKIIAADFEERFIRALANIVPAEDALARSGLVMSLTLGVRLVRDVIQAPALGDSQRGKLRPLLESMLAELLNAAAPGSQPTGDRPRQGSSKASRTLPGWPLRTE